MDPSNPLHQGAIRAGRILLDELASELARFGHASQVHQQRDPHGTAGFGGSALARVPLFTLLNQ
jgi:hypothetical protein